MTQEKKIEILMAALERIALFQPEQPVDEWSDAAAFRACQEIAEQGLNLIGQPVER